MRAAAVLLGSGPREALPGRVQVRPSVRAAARWRSGHYVGLVSGALRLIDQRPGRARPA
jgi:hypothetical protein